MRTVVVSLLILLFSKCGYEAPKSWSRPEPGIKFTALCNENTGHFASAEALSHQGKIYYNQHVDEVNDTCVRVRFDFISQCCQEFEGLWEISGDFLLLSYRPTETSGPVCDCYCDYRLSFTFDPRHYTWKKIRIRKPS